jgi:hypothetical protein
MPRRKNVTIKGEYIGGWICSFAVAGEFFDELVAAGRVKREYYQASAWRASALRYLVWKPRVWYLQGSWKRLLEEEVGAGKWKGWVLYPHRRLQLADSRQYVPDGYWVCTADEALAVGGGIHVGTG